MKYIASLHAYDCLDRINYSARVNAYSDYEHDGAKTEFIFGGNVGGVGETDPREWLRDVLVAFLEDL
jgi:hypothetical protein